MSDVRDVVAALLLVNRMHEQRTGRGADFRHAIEVAELLDKCGHGDLVVPAILHHVVDDLLAGRDEWPALAEPLLWKIRNEFGDDVADVVYELTDGPYGRATIEQQQLRHRWSRDGARVKMACLCCSPWSEHAARLQVWCRADADSTALIEAWRGKVAERENLAARGVLRLIDELRSYGCTKI